MPWHIKLQAPLILLATLLLTHSAFGQVDLSGEWGARGPKDAPDAEIGDYTGLPINDQARMRADAWDAEKWTQIEHECEPHPSDYAPRGPSSMRVWPDLDPLTEQITAWHTTIMWMLPQPARLRSPHVGGLLYRRMGRGHAEGGNDPPKGGVAAPQRLAPQRSR
jgi:hypothetical protein